MRRLTIALALVPWIVFAGQQPPYEEKNWETNENMRNVFLELDNLKKSIDQLSIPTVDVTISTPTADQLGKLVKTSAYVIYVATNTTDISGWVKVGGQ